jgi:hypothetical protein
MCASVPDVLLMIPMTPLDDDERKILPWWMVMPA